MNTTILTFSAVALYFASAGAIALRLFYSSGQHSPARPIGIVLGLLAAVLHGVVLYQSMVSSAGINIGFFHAIALAAWSIIMLLLVSTLNKPVENLAIILFPVAAVSLLLIDQYPSVHLINPGASWELKTHVLVSLLAYSILTLASVQALLLFLQDRKLRSHHPGGFTRALPPLQTMESLLFEMILVGFVLLSIALLSGFIFLEDMFAQHLVHKTVLSIIAWVTFALLLWGRFRFGWRGRTAIKWTLVGFALLMLAYFGSKAVLELILSK